MPAFIAFIGIPPNEIGSNGDDCLNTLTGAIYEKVSDVWEPKFSATSGNYFRSGSGVPSNALGIDDDYYMNLINNDLYEKVAGVWVLRYRKGGSTAYYSGTGAPTFLGGNGDHYLNQSTGDVYNYVDGDWNLIYSPGTSAGVHKIEIATSASTYSYNLAGRWLVGWEVLSDTSQSPKLGTTSGGDDLGAGDTGTGPWIGQGNSVSTLSATTIYFSGLAGNNDIILWLIG